MKKNSILYLLLVFLIIANGFFLFNYIGNNKGKKLSRPQKHTNFIIKELNFNEAQLEQFKSIGQEHQDAMMTISDDIKGLKEALFNRLSSASVNEKSIDSITSLIGQKEKEKDTEVFYHFKSIQNICNDNQKEKFKKIINDALLRGKNEDRPPRPDSPDGHRPPPPNNFQ